MGRVGMIGILMRVCLAAVGQERRSAVDSGDSWTSGILAAVGQERRSSVDSRNS
jgi:hypothetical protein